MADKNKKDSEERKKLLDALRQIDGLRSLIKQLLDINRGNHSA